MRKTVSSTSPAAGIRISGIESNGQHCNDPFLWPTSRLSTSPNSLPIRQNGCRSIGAWSCSTCRLLASADSSSLAEMLLDPKFPGSESLRLQDRPFGCLRQRRIATIACPRRPKQPATTGAGQNKRVDRVRRTAGCVRDRKPLAEGGSARRRTKSSAITVIRPSRGAGPSECVPPNCRGRLANTALGHAWLSHQKQRGPARHSASNCVKTT
jgi:hypothetical protein